MFKVNAQYSLARHLTAVKSGNIGNCINNERPVQRRVFSNIIAIIDFLGDLFLPNSIEAKSGVIIIARAVWISTSARCDEQTATNDSHQSLGHPEMACVGTRYRHILSQEPNLRKPHQSSRSSLRSANPEKKRLPANPHPSNPPLDWRPSFDASHHGENALNFTFVTTTIHADLRKNENINKHTCQHRKMRVRGEGDAVDGVAKDEKKNPNERKYLFRT